MTQYTDDELINYLIQFYCKCGRWPKIRDMKHPYPSRATYARRFASGPGMNDGFSRALTMAQIKHNNMSIKKEFEEVHNNLKELEKGFLPFVRWFNRLIMRFKKAIR